ncbi:ImmA/IrrE family metallo-endopeptidase [Thermoflavimicrobium dichotomicum]|uniref:Uncharacterized protein n=1 Tax=Thermoflavimicrobium dichotomicum TaxID=46223 RepID=A0A1I3RWV7_9BACL|nr:hypothetical protein [Thermoflavimicrobium dichotomicum]SFJ49879.1 hypothetical protein SAMN05421852_11130 [Thermoflavimicrobium dichotomicum]
MKIWPPLLSGLRSNARSQNRRTNSTPHNPYFSEIEQILKQHKKYIEKSPGIYFYTYETHPDFYQPLTMRDIQIFFTSIPPEFLRDLQAIFLCRGSKKQMLYHETIFGCYDAHAKSIFVFPFPKDQCLYFSSKPKPSKCLEYERHGAKWFSTETGGFFYFTKEALRSYYLRDVFAHELGHHVDHLLGWNHKNTDQIERFAEWFALTYGMGGY